MALLEWTQSIRAVSNIPGAADCAPGVNTNCRNACRPPIAVSHYLLALLVFHYKWKLWRCGQLWPYVGMGSLGTRLHWDCNVMGDAANTSPHITSTCTHNAIHSLLIIHIIPSRQIDVAIDNSSSVPSVCCLTTGSYHLNYVRAADGVTHAGNLQCIGCWCWLTWSDFETGSKLPECSGNVVGTRANQYWTKAPSSFTSLILNGCCSCPGRRPFIAP